MPLKRRSRFEKSWLSRPFNAMDGMGPGNLTLFRHLNFQFDFVLNLSADSSSQSYNHSREGKSAFGLFGCCENSVRSPPFTTFNTQSLTSSHNTMPSISDLLVVALARRFIVVAALLHSDAELWCKVNRRSILLCTSNTVSARCLVPFPTAFDTNQVSPLVTRMI